MHDVERPGEATDIKIETVVLPEGVCLLDKAFQIIEKDRDGKKFDKGSPFLFPSFNPFQFHALFAVVQTLL